MTWQQKLAAMQALCGHENVSLKMRAPDDWYVSVTARDVGGNEMLVGEYGNGRTPEEAVEDDWDKLTSLPEGRYIVVYRRGDYRKVTWNGWMWADVEEPAAASA